MLDFLPVDFARTFHLKRQGKGLFVLKIGRIVAEIRIRKLRLNMRVWYVRIWHSGNGVNFTEIMSF